MEMSWIQVLTIAGSTIGACWYMHRESLTWWLESQKEMKDFHGRLCSLEEKYIQMMQRILEEKRNK